MRKYRITEVKNKKTEFIFYKIHTNNRPGPSIHILITKRMINFIICCLYKCKMFHNIYRMIILCCSTNFLCEYLSIVNFCFL